MRHISSLLAFITRFITDQSFYNFQVDNHYARNRAI
jgi:hypothetical protein